MDIQNLIKMVNQIGDFFVAMPDAEEAKKDLSTHIQRTWDKRMIAILHTHIQNGGTGLSSFVHSALQQHLK